MIGLASVAHGTKTGVYPASAYSGGSYKTRAMAVVGWTGMRPATKAGMSMSSGLAGMARKGTVSMNLNYGK